MVWPPWYGAFYTENYNKRKVRKQRDWVIRATKMAWKLFQTPFIQGLPLWTFFAFCLWTNTWNTTKGTADNSLVNWDTF